MRCGVRDGAADPKGRLPGVLFLPIFAFPRGEISLILGEQPTEGNMPMSTEALIPKNPAVALVEGQLYAHTLWDDSCYVIFFFFPKPVVMMWGFTSFLSYLSAISAFSHHRPGSAGMGTMEIQKEKPSRVRLLWPLCRELCRLAPCSLLWMGQHRSWPC